MSVRRKIFYGFTLVLLAALLILPSTGWLARMQLFPFAQRNAPQSLNASSEGDRGGKDDDAARFVAVRPGDFELQFAHAMNGDSSEQSLARLAVLDKWFPDNPAVIAARLKQMSAGKVLMRRRAEENLLIPVSGRPKDPVTPLTPSDPADVATFVSIAEQGERISTDNAYFSCMVAVGNFARHRDAEATAAWKRAGAKPDWNDYTPLEMNAKQKLLIAQSGGSEVGFLSRIASRGAMFPHFAAVRASARVATVKAFQAELAGNPEEGIALRAATRHIGAVMMARSDTGISEAGIAALGGHAVAAIAQSRLGGAEARDTSSYTQTEREVNHLQKEQEARYVAYLLSVGHPEEAAAFAAVNRHGDAIKAIWKNGRTYMGFGEKAFRLLAGWYGCILLIAGALYSLTFAAIFKLVYRFSPRLQKGEPLQTSARWGVMLGLTLPVLVMGAAVAAPSASDLVCGGALITAALLLIVPPALCRLSAKSVGHGLLVLSGTLGTLAVVVSVGAATWHMYSGLIGPSGLVQSLYGGDPVQVIYQGNHPEELGDTKNVWGIIVPTVISILMLSLPVVLLGVFALFSRMLHIPVAAGVTRGMRAMAVPLACVMVIGWGTCLLFTLNHEEAAIREMKRFGEVGENSMQAELLGRTYPGMAEGLRVP